MSLIRPTLLPRISYEEEPKFSGTPEIGGWTTRELIQILRGLAGVNVVGADVVEVAPVYDTQAELTGLAAAGVVEALVELMVKKPVGHLEERK
jgi:agmatinase